MNNSKRLQGKTAIVTGASSGIGETTAIALAQEGAFVTLVARREDRLQSLARRIATDFGGDTLAIIGDVTDATTIESAVSETMAKRGRIDILINNAGIMLLGPIDGAHTSDWKRMIDINVLGLMNFTHAVVPTMKAQKSGHIVNISSVAGRVARAGSSGYNASKWAVGAFSEALRQEVCLHQIRVTIIEPGAVLTELTDHITHDDVKKQVKDRIAAMSALTAQDVANAIIYVVTQPAHVNINEILMRPTDQQA